MSKRLPCRNVIVMFEEEISRTLTDAMERAGFHPAQVFAVRRCGFVLTDANQSALTADQRSRWSEAVGEWYRLNAAS